MNKQPGITKEDAISFMVYCFFGRVDDPVLAAIDRAYLDMQTHTLSGEQKELYSGRKTVTEILYKSIENIDKDPSFDQWHKETAKTIKNNYPKLSYGQIQKWINMTIKYIITLKLLGVDGISDYFNSANSKAFHPALDSYVLNEINENETWSTISDYEQYDSIRKKMTFADEYVNWPQYAYKAGLKKNGEKRIPEKGTYNRYVWDKGGYSFSSNR